MEFVPLGFYDRTWCDEAGHLAAPFNQKIDAFITREFAYYLHAPLEKYDRFPTYIYTTFIDGEHKPMDGVFCDCWTSAEDCGEGCENRVMAHENIAAMQVGMGIISYVKYAHHLLNHKGFSEPLAVVDKPTTHRPPPRPRFAAQSRANISDIHITKPNNTDRANTPIPGTSAGVTPAAVLERARLMGDYLCDFTLTPPVGAWANFTRSTVNTTEWPHREATQGDRYFSVNAVQPDKGGIAGYALAMLYSATRERKYLRQALRNARALKRAQRPGAG